MKQENEKNNLDAGVDLAINPSTYEDDRIALYKKISALHTTLRALDWVKDGYNEHQKYAYFSEAMVKSNFQFGCLEVGLIYALDITDIVDMPAKGGISTLIRARTNLTLIDIDTGASFTYAAIAEAGDSGDKASAKLMTMALKSAIATNFAVADIDPESGRKSFAEDIATRESKNSEAIKKLNEKAKPATVKSEPAIKPAVKKPVEAVLPADKAVAKNEEIKPVEKPASEPKLAVPKSGDTAGDNTITVTQKRTMAMIYATLIEKKPAGLDVTKFDKEFKALNKDGNRDDALAWIKQYREMM